MEERNEKKRINLFSKRNIIIFIIVTVATFVMIMGGAFIKFKINLNDLASTQEEYEKSVKVTSEGISKSKKSTQSKIVQALNIQTATISKDQARYNRIASVEATSIQKLSDQNYNLTKQMLLSQLELDLSEKILVAIANAEGETQKSKAEELASEIEWLGDYIDDSLTQTKEQKLAYLMNAAIVTRYPYIQSIADDSTKLNGTIKFYRYLESIEDSESEVQEILLTFIDLSSFNAKLEEYKASGNEDVFNYFTIDEDENVVIAYGTKTTKKLVTTDNEVTLDTINEISTEVYSKTTDGEYTAEIYTANTKLIDYQSLAEPYILPFNLLSTLLIQTRNYSLVKEIADLAYNSEIIIGIYDNKSVTVRNDEYTYNKKIKYTENTELIFDNISTDPSVNISSSQYSEVVKECFGKLNETKENAIHVSGIDLEDLETATGNRTDGNVYETYISKISSEGKVTEISSNAVEFKTTLSVQKIENSAPTVGIILADVWAGKWTSTYVKEENNVNLDPSENGIDDEDLVKVATNKFAGDLLKESGAIGINLTNHSTQLRTKAIEKIIEKTDFTVTPKAMTVDDIRTHGNACEECKETLDSNYGTNWATEPTGETADTENANLLNAVNTQENLKIVKEHIEEILNKEAEEATAERKEKFITDINNVGQVTYNQWPTAYKANTSIKQISTYNKDATIYKKDSFVAEEQGEKFSSILSKAKYRKTKDAIITRESWFWDSIREYEDTAKIENLLRYLFNISFNTTAFGTFSTEDLESIFSIFEPKKEMLPASTSSFSDLKEYIRTFENGPVLDYINGQSSYTSYVSKYITEDKQYYIMQTDGYGHNTIGFGVDIFNGGFEEDFAAAGYSTDIGTVVPVEFVDALEEEELRSKLTTVKNRTKDLDLKLYQIYALVSRAYNCGVSGALDDFYTELNFNESYTKYFNPEEDNKYGEVIGDFDHELYTTYMDIPIKSNGEIAPGLVTRRKSEWTLFQTGYMDTLEKWCGATNYPDEIRTFKSAGYTFPEYPQTDKVGDTNLYAKERFGYPEANRTLGSSGCGIFSMSMILSGLLGDASIDPITLRDAMEKDSRIGYSYHAYNKSTKESNGSYAQVITHKDFLYETYGVSVERYPSYKEGIQALREGKALLAFEPGHYIVAVPVPDELQGEGYEFFIIDSARGHTGAYTSAQDFKTKTGGELKFLAIIAP